MDPIMMLLSAMGISEQFATPEAAMQAALSWINEHKGGGEEPMAPEAIEELKTKAKAAVEKSEKTGKTLLAVAKGLNVTVKDDDPSSLTDEALIAAAKKMIDTPDPTKVVARAEYDSLKARCDALDAAEQRRQRTSFLERGQAAGKIVASNRDWFESAYDADPEKADKLLEGAPVLASGTRVSGKNGDETTTNDRSKIIASAVREYDGDKSHHITTREAFAQDALRQSGLPTKLSDKEKELVGV